MWPSQEKLLQMINTEPMNKDLDGLFLSIEKL